MRFIPRSADLSDLTQHQLDQIANRLDNRPRACLGWRTPSEALQRAFDQDHMVSLEQAVH